MHTVSVTPAFTAYIPAHPDQGESAYVRVGTAFFAMVCMYYTDDYNDLMEQPLLGVLSHPQRIDAEQFQNGIRSLTI